MSVQGLYFTPTCETALPIAVPLCTPRNCPSAMPTTQGHVYLGPPHYTTLDDNFNNSPSPPNGEEYNVGGDRLTLPNVDIPSYIIS